MRHDIVTRRRFLAQAAAGGAALMLGGRALAQGVSATDDTATAQSPATNTPMDQGAARVVHLPPKPGAKASMSAAQRDALEHRLRCQCGCTLDVYTCRTTDFTCQVSPAMHQDVMALVAGGYDAQEILDAFVGTYGERVLMAPKKEGFNWLGYFAPFIALAGGAVAVTALVKRWQRPDAIIPAAPTATQSVGVALPIEPTPEELERLDAAVRGGEEAEG